MELPSYAEQLPDTPYNVGSGSTPYVKFLSAKSTKFPDYKARFPTVEEASPILVVGGEEELLKTVKVMTLAAHVYWAKIDPAGEIQAVSNKPPLDPAKDLCDTDCVDAVHLLFLEDGSVRVVMASYRRKTRTQFISSVLQQLAKVETEEWFNKSDHHQFTKGIKAPYARFTSTINFKRGVSKTNKQPYCAFNAQHAAVTIDEYRAVTEYMKEETNRAEVTAAISAFNTRKANLIKQAGN